MKGLELHGDGAQRVILKTVDYEEGRSLRKTKSWPNGLRLLKRKSWLWAAKTDRARQGRR